MNFILFPQRLYARSETDFFSLKQQFQGFLHNNTETEYVFYLNPIKILNYLDFLACCKFIFYKSVIYKVRERESLKLNRKSRT
jgi:hypothetical protein